MLKKSKEALRVKWLWQLKSEKGLTSLTLTSLTTLYKKRKLFKLARA